MITVTDLIAPVLANIPAATTISCEQPVPGDPTAVPVTATDNCDANVTIVFTPGTLVPDPNCINGGTITHTWVATDNCGNSDTENSGDYCY